MRVAAISDLHIGSDPARDSFGHEVGAFGRWLDTLERDHDRIVLLGDIFQCDHGGWGPSTHARELMAARRRAGPLVDRFDGGGYVYVHGNHDEIAAAELGTPSRAMLQGDGLRLCFTHGHPFDPVAARAQWAADLGTFATGGLRRLGLTGVARWFELRDVAVKHARFGGAAGPYVAGAREIAAVQRADVVVFGHTHCAEIVDGPPVYANTGTCSGGRRECLSIDTATRTVTWMRWPDASGSEAPPRILASHHVR